MDSLFTDAPQWLEDALMQPQLGLRAVIEGRVITAAGDGDAVLDLLLDWADVLDDAQMAAFDQAAADWVAARWGQWWPIDDADAVLVANAWQRVCDVAVQLRGAQRLRSALRSRAHERTSYLAPLSQSPSLDPLGRYLAAVGTRQDNADLAPLWWRMARLPEDVPLHHLRYAFHGMRWLPPVRPGDRGRFPPELAEFLLVAAESLARVGSEGRLADERARRLFLQLGRRALSLYPKPEWWLPHIDVGDSKRPGAAWIGELFPDAGSRAANANGQSHDRAAPPVPARRRRDANAAEFMVRGQELRQRLNDEVRTQSSPLAETLELADALILEQRLHAERTGEVHPFVQTLCNLATPVRAVRPDLAATWAGEAVEWEPSNGYPWTILTRAVRLGSGASEALKLAFHAVDRVPHNQATWHELGQVLLALRCVDQAQEIFEAELDRFGELIQPLHSLAHLRLQGGHVDDARSLFERVRAVDPNDWRGLTGLASALRAAGSAADAAALLRPHVTQGTSDGAQAIRKEYDRATRALEGAALPPIPEPGIEARVLTADVPSTFVEQARLLRRAAGRRGDMTLVDVARRLLNTETETPYVEVERALIDVEAGDLAAADARASSALERAPADLSLQYVRGHVAVRQVERDRPAYSRELMADVMGKVRPLGELNSVLGPLVELQAVRASLGMTDGEVVLAEQRRRLARMIDWRPHEQSDERGWWERRVREVIFREPSPAAATIAGGAVDEIRSQISVAGLLLGQLQEEFVTRVAASA